MRFAPGSTRGVSAHDTSRLETSSTSPEGDVLPITTAVSGMTTTLASGMHGRAQQGDRFTSLTKVQLTRVCTHLHVEQHHSMIQQVRHLTGCTFLAFMGFKSLTQFSSLFTNLQTLIGKHERGCAWLFKLPTSVQRVVCWQVREPPLDRYDE